MNTIETALAALLLGILMGTSLYAQQDAAHPADETPTIQPVIANGGFLALHASPTRMNGSTGLLIGGGLFGVFGERIRVGIAGAGLVNDVHGRGATAATRRNLTFGYCGMQGEYLIASEKSLGVSAYMLAGAGGVLYHGPIDEPQPAVAKPGGSYVELEIDRAGDAFFIAEPGMSVEAGITTNLRLSAGAGYRFVHGVTTDGVSNATLSGPIATLMLRLGVF